LTPLRLAKLRVGGVKYLIRNGLWSAPVPNASIQVYKTTKIAYTQWALFCTLLENSFVLSNRREKAARFRTVQES
jgi:hypothetical protein